MLPPAAYTSAEVFAWERRHFLGGGWICVAHGSRLPAAGDQLAVDTGTGGALLVRGEDGAIRAFANTCRHRGHELLPCGSAASARPSSARTTRGRTRSPVSFAAHPGSARPPALMPGAWPWCRCR